MRDFERITSKDNELVKKTALLVSSSKARREEERFVLDGLRLCRDAVLNNFPIECFIVGESAFQKFGDDAKFLSENAERSCIVPDYIISKISDTVNPQGFMCICSMKQKENVSVNPQGKYIALENMADPSNLGAVSRTAEAFAFDGVFVSSNGCDPYNPKALRASMGALLRIPVIILSDFCGFIEKSELKSYACVIDKDAESLESVKFSKGSVALIGNEANGLTEKAISVCDCKITIHMSGKAESLNAATAGAVVMWEMTKTK